MIRKSYISDCEGPLSLNDNAFEISEKFIPNGDEFFKIISGFDDYLVEDIGKENYHAGDTLKLIAPFFKAYGITNRDIVDFSTKNIFMLNGAIDTLNFSKSMLPSFIISTSYEQYIKALCDYTKFPFENTYKTSLDLDKFSLSSEEIKTLKKYKDEILDGDFNNIYDIFFNKIPKMEAFNILNSVVTVGGRGKQLAMEDILKNYPIDAEGILYTGDSITDVEPLRFVREHNGIAISFNGNEFAIREAEIAIISDNTIITSIILDLFNKFDKNHVLTFIESYIIDPILTIEEYDIDLSLQEQYKELYLSDDKNLKLPIVDFIKDDNKDRIIDLSSKIRQEIRGKSIGNLG